MVVGPFVTPLDIVLHRLTEHTDDLRPHPLNAFKEEPTVLGPFSALQSHCMHTPIAASPVHLPEPQTSESDTWVKRFPQLPHRFRQAGDLTIQPDASSGLELPVDRLEEG